MKNIIFLFLLIIGLFVKAQTNCQNAQPFCAGGSSGVTFPATVNGPPAQTGPNYGCLGTQPNPAWYYLQISASGSLDLYIAGTSNQDVDFICWGPFTNLSTACNSLTAGNTVDCSYSSSPTETLNIINAVAGQYYMVLITNFSNAPQNITFNQIGGTGSTNCSLLASNTSICSGSSATIVATNTSSLSNPSYSLNPGALTSPNATFVVSPTVTTTYTVYVTGTNTFNAVQTTTAIANVTVNPQPQVSPSFTQATCTSSYNAVNLGLTFTPSTPNYTISWNPLPGSSPNATQTTASNLQQGTTGVTVTSTGGCSVTTSFTMAQVPLPVTFTINPPGGIYSITCSNPTVNLNANPLNYTYTWTSTGNSFTGTSVSFSAGDQGNYTVTPTNPVTGCVGSPQTFTIGLNVTPPTSSVNPSTQVITCANGLATFTGTALSPTVNVGHEWYAPGNPPPNGPASFTSAGVTSLYSAIGIVGTFTYIVRNLTNGCIVTKTVSVGSASGFPTFQTSSSTNYTVGCSPLNQTTLCIVNAQSTNSTSVQYAFLPPASTATLPLPSGAFGLQSCTITGT
ncbi:MAG: hypothetical protein HYX39_03395, partial [Bacteroidetes bacterium]|nr:hypothetical protein [Bacteroidota bacterium]